METISQRNARLAADAYRRSQHTLRADFWQGKADNAIAAIRAPMGKLEREAAASRAATSDAQARWHSRYLEACQPVQFSLIQGGKA